MMVRSAPLAVCLVGMALLPACASTPDAGSRESRFAAYVWPLPPDDPRIQLVDIVSGRADVEADTGFQRALLGASPQGPYENFMMPFGVVFDREGRLLVTDPGLGALFRINRVGRRMDVFGTSGAVRLQSPMGVSVGAGGTIYVADSALQRIVAFDQEGGVLKVYGESGDLVNPTDVAPGPGGTSLYVADSRAHKVVVFAIDSGEILFEFGSEGVGPGEFNYPTSLAFAPDNTLYVVDQLNARVQVLSEEGDYIDEIGRRGVGFGDLVRPKDVAVDRFGYIYVTDAAFNNLQLFDTDFTLLTFVGEGGDGPGQFHNAAGVAVRGDDLAIVDQLGRRVQLFRYLSRRSGE